MPLDKTGASPEYNQRILSGKMDDFFLRQLHTKHVVNLVFKAHS